jgi:putative phosphoesterase
MKIAVLSDSHDRMDHLEQAVAQVKELGISQAFHLGDFCAPFVLEYLAETGITWHCVWGNNDVDRLGGFMKTTQHNVDLVTEDFRELEMEGRKLFLTHYPKIARIAALSGLYDACFFGHNHKASVELMETPCGRQPETLLANPGEIYGMRFGRPSFGVYDTQVNNFEHVWLSKKTA